MPNPSPNSSTAADPIQDVLSQCMTRSPSRLEFWADFLRSTGAERIAEVGVYRGDFAAFLLERCPQLSRYYMIDPWRHLDDWNKPANQNDSVLSEFFHETKSKTEFAAAKRVMLRGKTTEVIDQIPDAELDFAYIDGDHTLRGITIDLIRLYPKIRIGGFLGGDDFGRSIWQHSTNFEPTLVFPFAVYFAEAVGAPIYALPNSQFLMHKSANSQFAFIDLTGHYDNLELRDQVAPEKLLKLIAKERFPRLNQAGTKARDLLSK